MAEELLLHCDALHVCCCGDTARGPRGFTIHVLHSHCSAGAWNKSSASAGMRQEQTGKVASARHDNVHVAETKCVL